MSKPYWLPYHFLLLQNEKNCICTAQQQAKSVVTDAFYDQKMHLNAFVAGSWILGSRFTAEWEEEGEGKWMEEVGKWREWDG